MKLNLTIKERAVLGQITPKEGNFATMTRLNKFFEEIELSEQEIEDHNVRPENGILVMKEGSESYTKEIEIGEIVEETLKKTLKKLDEDGKLTVHMLSLYEKIVESAK
jgi:ACT domain-containing protein